MEGGWFPIEDIKDPSIDVIAKFAITKNNKENNLALKLQTVVSGESQAVRGTIFRLIIDVSEEDDEDSKTYEAEVYEQLWLDNPLYKGYKCFHPLTGRVYISRHVFDENKFPYKDIYKGLLQTAQIPLLFACMLGNQISVTETNQDNTPNGSSNEEALLSIDPTTVHDPVIPIPKAEQHTTQVTGVRATNISSIDTKQPTPDNSDNIVAHALSTSLEYSNSTIFTDADFPPLHSPEQVVKNHSMITRGNTHDPSLYVYEKMTSILLFLLICIEGFNTIASGVGIPIHSEFAMLKLYSNGVVRLKVVVELAKKRPSFVRVTNTFGTSILLFAEFQRLSPPPPLQNVVCVENLVILVFVVQLVDLNQWFQMLVILHRLQTLS
ncbi:unnamed protein product [Arabidopsis halleri]